MRKKGGAGLESVSDVMVRLETADHEPRFGLAAADLQNLRLTSSAFRDAFPANARWQWYLSRSPALNLVWLAHSNGIRFAIDQQIWTITDEGVNELYICKSRTDQIGSRQIYFKDVMSTPNYHVVSHDETISFDETQDLRRRFRDIESYIDIPNDMSVHTEDEIDFIITESSFELPFYLNIYLPNVPVALKPRFLELVGQVAASSAMNPRPLIPNAAASYGKIINLTETFDVNVGGARSGSKSSSSKSKSSSSKSSSGTGRSGNNSYSSGIPSSSRSRSTSTSIGSSNGSSSERSDHSHLLKVPFYFNVYFKAKPSMTMKPVRVLQGCPSLY